MLQTSKLGIQTKMDKLVEHHTSTQSYTREYFRVPQLQHAYST